MSYTKLHSHKAVPAPEGLAVVNMTARFTLGSGHIVEVPIPYLPIGGDLVLTPFMAAEGESNIRIDTTRWSPGYIGAKASVRFPLNFGSEEVAIRVGRAFDADPTTSWDDKMAEMIEWFRGWGPANGFDTSNLGQ